MALPYIPSNPYAVIQPQPVNSLPQGLVLYNVLSSYIVNGYVIDPVAGYEATTIGWNALASLSAFAIDVGTDPYGKGTSRDLYLRTSPTNSIYLSAAGLYLNGTQITPGGGGGSSLSAIYGTPNQITAVSANNAVTLSLPNIVNITTLNVLSTLNVAGSANFYNTSNLNISSAIIYFGEGNTANLLDLGLVAHFTDASNNRYQHTGFVRRANQGSPGAWTLFSGLTTEPGTYGVNGINWNDPYLQLDTLSANVISNTISANNIYSSGNVGIGTTSPYVPLSFGTGTVGSPGQPNILRLYDPGTSTGSYGFGISPSLLSIVSPANTLFTAGNQLSALYLQGSTGNVGIGTVTPNVTLTVNGSISATGNVTSPNIQATYMYNTTVLGTTALPFPPSTYPDGTRIVWRITQGAGGPYAITVSTGTAGSFRIPTSTGSTTLPFSQTVGYMDILGLMWDQPANRWDVISFTPGYYT